MAGIAASGAKRAKKAGINHKVDPVEYLVSELFDNNAAAATLLAKPIPPEAKAEPAAGARVTVNIHPIASGTFLSPQAMEHLRATHQLPLDATITLLDPTNLAEPLQLERQASLPEPAPNNIIPMRGLRSPTDLKALVDDLASLPAAELEAILDGGKAFIESARDVGLKAVVDEFAAMTAAELKAMAEAIDDDNDAA